MTKEDKLKACEMRLNGSTYREIADSFGVSYQYIQKILPKERDIEIKGIYVGIKKWMKENRFKFADVAKMCDAHYNTIYLTLNGKHIPRKDTIDKILNVTGLTYEEAFRVEE